MSAPVSPGKRSTTQDLRPIPANGMGGGSAQPAGVRAKMETAFGTDFSTVRIHEDGAAQDLDAQAYTRGTDIHFAPGRYNPTSSEGLELLGHELTHVVQQAQGCAAETVQHKGNSINDSSALEREADTLGAMAARGSLHGLFGSASLGAGATVVQRKVTAIPSARLAKIAVLGDGTAANPGMTIDALEAYVTRQANWFTDPSFAAAERESTWKVVNLFHFGGHVSQALAKLHAGEVAALADRTILMKYASCFDSSAETVQLKTVAPNLARALQLGQAIKDLEDFVPTAVLRHVIPESGLVYLVDKAKLGELKKYYTVFKPTLEKPEEWPHVEQLLTETIARWAPLAGWVSELHIFTLMTRVMLLGNIGDRSRTRPVLLVLMSALDWNTAFLQASNLEAVMLSPKNLALIVQGRTIANVTAQVTRVANDYGKGKKLGQVVLAGHGSDTSMEMASDSKDGWWDAANDRVAYDGQGDIDSSTRMDKDPKKTRDPKTNGTELLIDTVLNSMDPATANIVFAGCLINSHDIDPKMDLTGNAAAVQKKLRDNIAAHPNLADYVRARMKATGHAATLGASNSSTTFDSFNLDATGKAQLSNPGDPDVAGTKLQYVKTGIEAEGALRAAIECCADPALGIAKTTAEMRARVAALAGTTDWGLIVTRLGFELALSAAGDANVTTMVAVVHRIRVWVDYNATVNAQSLADSVKKAEATKVFTALLVASGPDLETGIHHAWTKYDPAHAAKMMVSLTTSGFTSEDFAKMLSRSILDKHLAALLPVGALTRGQIILALTIADQDGAKMPKPVCDFLRAAAGGATTRRFPAALDVDTILPNGTPKILEAIGLSPKSPPAIGATIDGNVDADHDGKNETHVVTDPHKAKVTVAALVVRDTPTSSGKSLGTIAKPLVVRVMGTTRAGTWSLIDFNGATGFVATQYLK
jgi:hypothetical protein